VSDGFDVPPVEKRLSLDSSSLGEELATTGNDSTGRVCIESSEMT